MIAVGVHGDIVLVRHQHDGIAFRVQRCEQRHDLVAGGGVERAGGLVGQQDRRIVHQRPGDGHALALAARKLAGLVQHAVFQIHLFQSRLGLLGALVGGTPA